MSPLNTRNPVISALIFPLAPIAVIFLTHMLCREIWMESYYVPGEDGGEAEPAMALIGVPLLLLVGSLLLGSLTWLNKWGSPRWLTAFVRVPLAGFALLLWLTATIFFMGQAEAVFSHWQVASAWLAWLASAGMFVLQQWDRLRR